MKKSILAAAAALTLVSMASCHSGSAASTDKTGMGDSLAETFGTLQGYQFSQYLESMDSTERAKINIDAVLKGMKTTLFTDTTDMGYMIGQNIGIQFLSELQQIERMTDIRVSRDVIYQCFEQALRADSVPDANQLPARMQQFSIRIHQMMQEKEEARQMQQPEVQQNLSKGKQYIEAQKKADPSIKTTSSGLSYKVVAQGDGTKVQPNDKVKLKYTGKLIDGSEFDSSKGETVEMSPSQVIPGFKEALLLMSPGAHYVVYIPGDLAYGINGVPGKIPPMSTLVFDIEVESLVHTVQAPDAGTITVGGPQGGAPQAGAPNEAELTKKAKN